MEKQVNNWEGFEEEWINKIKIVKGALKLIKLYPERLTLLTIGNLLQDYQIEKSQKEWVSLYNKLQPIEKSYFKPYFTPINSDSFQCFVDLSNDKLPIFEPIYDCVNHNWFQLNRFESILELIYFLDSESNTPPIIDKELARKIDLAFDNLSVNQIVRKFNQLIKAVKIE